jgi:hypothetical protein
VVNKVTVGQVYHRGLRFFLFRYDSTNASSLCLSACYSYRKDKREKPGNIPKSNAVSEIWDYCIEEYFQLVIKGVSGSYSGVDAIGEHTCKCGRYFKLDIVA